MHLVTSEWKGASRNFGGHHDSRLSWFPAPQPVTRRFPPDIVPTSGSNGFRKNRCSHTGNSHVRMSLLFRSKDIGILKNLKLLVVRVLG